MTALVLTSTEPLKCLDHTDLTHYPPCRMESALRTQPTSMKTPSRLSVSA